MAYEIIYSPKIKFEDRVWDCPKCGSDGLKLPEMPSTGLGDPPWGEDAECLACKYRAQLGGFWRVMADQVGDYEVEWKERNDDISRESAPDYRPTTPEDYIEGILCLVTYWITMHTTAIGWFLLNEEDDDPREAAMKRFAQEPIMKNENWGWYFDWKEAAIEAYAKDNTDTWQHCEWCGYVCHRYDMSEHENECDVAKAWETYEEEMEEYRLELAEWEALGDEADPDDEPMEPDEPDSKYCTCEGECDCSDTTAREIEEYIEEMGGFSLMDDGFWANEIGNYVLEAVIGAGFDVYYETMNTVWDGHLQAMLDGIRQVEFASDPAEQLAAAQMLANLNHVNGGLVTYASHVNLDGDYLDEIRQDGLAAHLDADALQEFFENGVTV